MEVYLEFQRCSEWLTCYLVVAMVSWVVVKTLLKGKMMLEHSEYILWNVVAVLMVVAGHSIS